MTNKGISDFGLPISEKVVPFGGAFAVSPGLYRHAPRVKAVRPGENKVVEGLEEVFRRIPVRSGMTISFHHHFRNGDRVVNSVLAAAAKLGIRGLKIALTAVFPVHAPLIDHVKAGVVAALDTNYLSGPVADAVSSGLFERPVILRTHGGRARAVECGQLKIDVAFIGAPAADGYGNINGVDGRTPCGSLGYAFPDAEYADVVVAVTDHLVEYPLTPVSIRQTRVGYVVTVDAIGDPRGILSGTTLPTEDPVQLGIAKTAAAVLDAAGAIRDGVSFQTGAGGISLAAGHAVWKVMERERIRGSFVLGGITAYMVKMLERGLLTKILDVQDFDPEAVRSLAANRDHMEIGADFYANPFNAGCAVNKLDFVILGATEVDTDFNINVVTGSHGAIMGGSGGHADAAAGAKLTIVVANLARGARPTVVDRVITVTTPGETVDVVITEHGVAVNPRRPDLCALLRQAGLQVTDIEELKLMADRLTGDLRPAAKSERSERIVAAVEYRDGTIIDLVHQQP